jgi:hypothetical protein
MKTPFIVSIAIVGFALLGCTKDKERMITTDDQTQKRVHTQEELKKTGQAQVGPALEKTDTSVETSHR